MRLLRPWAGRLCRAVFEHVSAYVIIAQADGKARPAAAALLPDGYKFVQLDQDKLDMAYAAGRMEQPHHRKFSILLSAGIQGVGIAQENGEVVGWHFVSTGLKMTNRGGSEAVPDENYHFNHDLYVHPDFRGRNFGMALNLYLLENCTAWRGLFCTVRCNNTPALANWRRCGVTPQAKLSSYRIFRRCWFHRFSPIGEFKPARKNAVGNLLINQASIACCKDDFTVRHRAKSKSALR